MTPPDPRPAPIDRLRQELIDRLKEAAEIEQQFMCMYLYAAFSLKKAPDATCTPAQLEVVRRWASTIYMIARQEMEHLALVNGMLTAVGAAPHFTRDNLPAQSRYLSSAALARKHYDAEGPLLQLGPDEPVPCSLPFVFERFDLPSARRYTCMESPELAGVPDYARAAIRLWCFERDGRCPCVLPEDEAEAGGALRAGRSPYPMHRSYVAPTPEGAGDAALAATPDAATPDAVEIGTIEELYDDLKRRFTVLDRLCTEQGTSLFAGDPAGQVEILSEYDIYLFPITDLSSALAACDLITKQGEGLGSAAGYDSHFINFYEVAESFEQVRARAKRPFEPSLPVPRNPTADDVRDPFTRLVFDLFNDAYVALLYVLTGLYSHYRATTGYPHLSAALRETAFAPMMTMLVRTLGEVLVRLPLAADGPERAGPSFFIPEKDDRRLAAVDPAVFADVATYHRRFARLLGGFDAVLAHEAFAGLPRAERRRLRYARQNLWRMTANLRQIYQSGVYPPFEALP